MSLTNRTVLRDYVALSELNYIYPFNVLPSNNFFRRIRPNPYYLANELRNIEIDLERKPTKYQSSPSADVQDDVDHPKWSLSLGSNKATVIGDDSQKSLVGPYFDTVNNQAGVQYNYRFQAKLKMVCPVEMREDRYVILGFNLLNKPVPSAFTNNMIKYTKIGCSVPDAKCPCLPKEEVLNPCETIASHPQGKFTPVIEGQIRFFGKKREETFSVNLAGAVPHLECPECKPKEDVYYVILGKRLYLAVRLEDREWDIDSAISNFGVSIVEERVPTLFSALGSA